MAIWRMRIACWITKVTHTNSEYVIPMNFMVAPCINNIRHLIVQLMHTNYKILRLLK